MRRIDVMVTLDALHKQLGHYPPWELPILDLVHGGQLAIQGESRCDARVPDPSEEYARLERRFGVNKETHVTRVAEVYGAGSIGVQNLANAMREDLEEQRELDEQPDPEPEQQLEKQPSQSTQGSGDTSSDAKSDELDDKGDGKDPDAGKDAGESKDTGGSRSTRRSAAAR